MISALPKGKRIYYYELLWPVAAVFMWQSRLQGAYPISYEDNDGARFNLLSGFSNVFASSLMLALFWGASAAQVSRPWIARVASGDNPADCLTRHDADRSHLNGAKWEDASRLAPLWEMVSKSLKEECFPDWHQWNQLLHQSWQ